MYLFELMMKFWYVSATIGSTPFPSYWNESRPVIDFMMACNCFPLSLSSYSLMDTSLFPRSDIVKRSCCVLNAVKESPNIRCSNEMNFDFPFPPASKSLR